MNTTTATRAKRNHDGSFLHTPSLRAFAACVKGGVPVIFTGQPGEGKTSRLEAMAHKWGMYFESITGSNRDATDFGGLPVEGEHVSPDGSIHRVQRYTSLDWARRLNDACIDGEHTGAMCLIDEFNTQDDTMKAMLRVLEERYAGPDKFHDNVVLVAAMNPVNIATGGIDLPAAVANRVIHLDWEFDFDQWADGLMSGFTDTDEPELADVTVDPTDATYAKVRASVVRFLEVQSQLRSKCPSTNPEEAAGAWPSPRMWTKAINAMVHLDEDDDAARRVVLTGAVGKAAATAYITWAKQNDLYNPEEVLAKPSIVNWKDRPDRLYAMTLGVAALIQARDDSALWRKGMSLFAVGASAGRMDTAWIGARKLVNNPPSDGKRNLPPEARKAFHDQLKAIGLLADEEDAFAA